MIWNMSRDSCLTNQAVVIFIFANFYSSKCSSMIDGNCVPCSCTVLSIGDCKDTVARFLFHCLQQKNTSCMYLSCLLLATLLVRSR